MTSIVLIPARLQATRLPGKPLADIAGKPMIQHVWERCVQAEAGRVVVATDSTDIQRVIENIGGEAVMTRDTHASGSDRIFEALTTLDGAGRHDVIINVQGDLPTLEPRLVSLCAEILKQGADIATLAAPCSAEEASDPAVVKVVLGGQRPEAGGQKRPSDLQPPASALYFSRAPIPHSGPYLHHIGLYAYTRPALERFVALPPSRLEKTEKLEQLRALEDGMRIDVGVVDTVPLGVDTPETLEKAREYHAKRH